ncbi:TPA: hypothetical protein DF272_02720 [Candidatus Falkowbacteria bacterium]|nr:hypothetical protein [Candidatus Falkowbacteria bacterium]
MKKILVFIIFLCLPVFSVIATDSSDSYPPVDYDKIVLPEEIETGFSLAEPSRDSSSSNVGFIPDDLLYDWVIEAFDAVYQVKDDGTIEVTETILADFHEEKHGIFRSIPIEYKDTQGFNYKLRISNVSVTNEVGDNYPIADRGSNPFYLKIGDPDVTLTGKHIYVIQYTIDRGIRFFTDHDEFYFNITGSEWDTYIAAASATIKFDPVAVSETHWACYFGSPGNDSEGCVLTGQTDSELHFAINRPLMNAENEDFTVVVWLPKGAVPPLTLSQQVKYWILDNWGLFIAPIVFLLMFYLWWRKGHDPKFTKTVIAQYDEDPALSPLLANVILKDATFSSRALSAEIVYLAAHGYMTITEILKPNNNKVDDYELVRIKEPDDKLKSYQRILLTKLFSLGVNGKVLMKKDLKYKFHLEIPKIRNEVNKAVEPYYATSPEWRIGLMIVGGLVGGGGWIAGVTLGRLDLTIGGVLAGIAIVGFGWFMPKKTLAGQELAWHTRGLKEFIKVTDKDRAKFYEDKNMFVKGLPYAMVFGLADKWGKAFEGIYTESPDWYHTTRMGAFNSLMFTNSISSFSSTSNSNSFAAPSSSSGFSGGGAGGGFGGGGGGSW